MADYWDEHGANEDEYIEDIFDFIRRLNSGQLPSHWHLEDYADLRLPANVVRMLFDNNPGSQRKTSEWFIEAIEENDSFPGEFKGMSINFFPWIPDVERILFTNLASRSSFLISVKFCELL